MFLQFSINFGILDRFLEFKGNNEILKIVNSADLKLHRLTANDIGLAESAVWTDCLVQPTATCRPGQPSRGGGRGMARGGSPVDEVEAG
jgi:hypothetical protein